MTSIADRLVAAKRNAFVGREPERALFREAVFAEGEPPFCILYLYGPGGIGKSTLLSAFVDLCTEHDVSSVLLDGRNIDPSPGGFLTALRSALLLNESDDPLAILSEQRRRVLFIDTCELLTPLEGWLREVFLPGLSGDILVVLAGRQPLSAAWLGENGWQDLIRIVPLRNLSPTESRAFLSRRSVPESLHAPAIHFTHGHPLALSLLADVFTRNNATGQQAEAPALKFTPETTPDVVQALLDRFIEGVPGPRHRSALETCALLRITDEGILREMLRSGDGSPDRETIRELFEWLRGLSFIEASASGIFPHDVVREALLADLRWRDRDRYIELHSRARAYYAERLIASTLPADQQRLLYDCIFLHRDNAVVRAAFDWRESPAAYPDTLRETDRAALVEMVRRYEGEESAEIAAGWLERQPERTVVFRDPADSGGGPAGFFTMLSLRAIPPEERAADPALTAVWNYLESHAPLRAGENATYLRFWMAREGYQSPSPVQSLIIVHALRHFLTGSHLAFTFFACAEPDLWEAVFEYVQIERLHDAGFRIGGHAYGVYGHDWRTTPASVWLEHLFEKEVAAGGATMPETRPVREEPLLVVLSEPEFTTAVRDALRGLHQADALRENPLLRSRIVASRVTVDAPSAERAETLRQRILEEAARLQAAPKQARGYRALQLTYLEPAGTQEQAADQLDLPFNTYRRHLGEGIAALTELLWREELGNVSRS